MEIQLDNRERIRLKAKEMFMQYGLRSVSMDDLATSLGISKKTIYQSFKDKNEIVQEVVLGILNENTCLCKQESARSSNAVEEMLSLAGFLFDVAKNMNGSILFELMKYHPKTHEMLAVHKHEHIPKMVEENLRRGIEEGYYRSEIKPEILSQFRGMSVFAVFQPNFMKDKGTSKEDIQREVFLHFMHGIVNEKGLRLLNQYKEKINN